MSDPTESWRRTVELMRRCLENDKRWREREARRIATMVRTRILLGRLRLGIDADGPGYSIRRPFD